MSEPHDFAEHGRLLEKATPAPWTAEHSGFHVGNAIGDIASFEVFTDGALTVALRNSIAAYRAVVLAAKELDFHCGWPAEQAGDDEPVEVKAKRLKALRAALAAFRNVDRLLAPAPQPEAEPSPDRDAEGRIAEWAKQFAINTRGETRGDPSYDAAARALGKWNTVRDSAVALMRELAAEAAQMREQVAAMWAQVERKEVAETGYRTKISSQDDVIVELRAEVLRLQVACTNSADEAWAKTAEAEAARNEVAVRELERVHRTGRFTIKRENSRYEDAIRLDVLLGAIAELRRSQPPEDKPAAAPEGEDLAMSLFHIQDSDRPMYVLARDWSSALDAWWRVIRAENEGDDDLEDCDGISKIADPNEVIIDDRHAAAKETTHA
jgi:hypothetical protein